MNAKIAVAFATVALAVCGSLAAAQPTPGREVNMARFCARQSSRPQRYYPGRAMERAQEGVVTLDCIMTGNAITTCRVVDETNPHWGFDDAALRIACNFTLQRGPDGAMTLRHAPSDSSITTDTEGRTHARIPVRFQLTVSTEPPPPPPPQ